jgi:hypothetical protein
VGRNRLDLEEMSELNKDLLEFTEEEYPDCKLDILGRKIHTMTISQDGNYKIFGKVLYLEEGEEIQYVLTKEGFEEPLWELGV